MKNNNIMLVSMLAIGIVSLPAHAEKGSANGQPFKALQTQININRTLIEANATAITGLNESVADINLRINDLDGSINELAVKVGNNTVEIATVLAKVTSAEDGIAVLRAEVSDLAERHTSDMETINQALAVIDSELMTLNDLRKALADELNAKLAALNTKVDDSALAIDALMLQLVTVNAQLTSINSNIMDLGNRATQLEAAQAQYAAQLADLTELAHELENAVDTLQSYHLFSFEGIQTDLPVASLNGWTECYKTTYADGEAHPENMMSVCTGSKIMLACRQTGSDTLKVAAYANREEVFQNTGDSNNVVHTANGVDWYFSNNYSMGFAPVGEGVLRTSADVKSPGNPDRLSWHTHDWYTPGWRCGSAVGLNGNAAWEKIIYQAD